MMVLHKIYNRLRVAKVKQLIRTGHNVNAYDKSGWTPLLRAAYHGHVEATRELIGGGADIHLKVKESGRSVLHIAAYYGHQELVKFLLENNININEQDDEGRTAVMLAVGRGHSAVVAELVKAGADISLEDKGGTSAVLLATSYDMVHQLIRDVDHLSREDRSRILWHACDVGDLSTVQSVIEAGCDVDHIHKGQTPVMMATLRGHDGIVKELILANCNVSVESEVLFRDMPNTLNFGRVNWAKVSYWMAAVVCVLLPCHWMKSQMDVLVTLLTDPVWSSAFLIVMLALAVAEFLIMPGSWIVMIVSGMVAIAVVMAMNVAMTAGPVAWAASVMVVLAIPLMIRGPKVTMAAVTREVMGTVMNATLSVSAVSALIFVVPVILLWSPRDIVMTWAEAVTGLFTIMAVIALTIILLKKMVPIWQDLVVAVLKGVILTGELFIIASSCMVILKKSFVLNESQTLQGMVELLTTVVLFNWFLLMVLKPQATEMALSRGCTVIIAFEAAKALKMEDALVSLDKLHLVLVVLVMAKSLAGLLAAATKKAVLLKGVVMLLQSVVALAEAYLAVVIAKEGAELWTGMANLREVVNPIVVLVMVLSFQPPKDTSLHHAASCHRIQCGILLVEAGADVRAKNRHHLNPLELGSRSFVDEIQKVLFFTPKRVIAVIGNTECGKSTLVAALEHTSGILWKKVVNRFKKVHDIRNRTAGIEAVVLSNQKYGEALFYDFAGQSQYHGPHQSFLEAMLSKPGVSVTLLLLVKATEEEGIITQQLYRWLQPLALMSTPSTPKVMVVGSFLDKVKSKEEAFEKLLRCAQSAKTELHLSIQGPCLLDCRRPESRGINHICSFLQEAHPVNTKTLSYNLHWVLVHMRKAFTVPALRFHEFQTWLQDSAANLPRTLPSPEEVCQDLSATGHTLFLTNKRDPSQNWLILNLPALLHDVYGILFSMSQGKVNEFGILHCSQLKELFPYLDLEMFLKVLNSLEFCIQIDPLLLKEELSKLTTDPKKNGWLYFPALVSAQPYKVFQEDPIPEQFRWICWQLKTAEKHIISAHLLQTIILRLAAKHVFIQEPSPGVTQHCCRVWVNGISWSSTKGVDIAVQISDSNMVQVIGCSKVEPQRLQEYTAAIVQDVTRTIAQLSSKLEATSYIVHPYTPTLWEDPNAPPNSLYLVSTINCCINGGDDHVPSLSPNTRSIPIGQLFGGELPSLLTVQCLNYPSVAQTFNGSAEGPLNPLLSTPTLVELNHLAVWRVAAQWNPLGLSLGVEPEVLSIIKANHPGDVEGSCRGLFLRWLSRWPGTGKKPRVWQSVLEAVKATVGDRISEEIGRELFSTRSD